MAARRLYQHLRESGINVTLREAEELRESWLKTFPEMQHHFQRTPLAKDPYERYGWKDDEGDLIVDITKDKKAEKKKGRKLYEVTTITGFHRNRTTLNACMNTEFQNPVAHMAKEALWNLECAGLGNRLLNFVHDEVDYWLYPHEVKQLVPIIEQLWLAPGKIIFPDVKLKCETEVGLYWDKGNTEFGDLEWDAKECPVLKLPEFVAEAYKQK